MAKTSDLLLARLKAIGLDVISVERTYRSLQGASAGQWAWAARMTDGSEIGSEDTMLACVKADHLTYGRPPHPCAGLQVYASN